jgi:hypothetical protein
MQGLELHTKEGFFIIYLEGRATYIPHKIVHITKNKREHKKELKRLEELFYDSDDYLVNVMYEETGTG